MKFLVVTMSVESNWESGNSKEGERVYNAYVALQERMKREGVFLDSIRLRFSNEAKSIRYHPNSRTEFVDGPFYSAKEQIGGAFLLECRSIDEAFEWAKQMPNYGHGGLEVRPLWE